MKFLAGILAFMVLMLSVQPAFASFTESEEVECSSECCKHESNKTDDDHSEATCSDFCNPLLKCGSSAFGKMEFLHFSIDIPAELASKPAILTASFFSQFSPDFWQPPRAA